MATSRKYLSRTSTLLGRVRQLEDGRWESRGEAFEVLMARMRPKGFRAVLWHQG